MVALLAIVSSLVAASSVQAVRIPNVHRSLSHRTVTPPEGWITEIMEPYAEYNARYTALNCKAQHNTAFFDACCHPMKKNETLETARASYCNPANEPVTSVASAVSTSAASAATNVSTGDDGDDDDDEDCEDDDDDDDEDCEDDDDDEATTSAVPTPTPTPSKMKTSKISKPTSSPAAQTSTSAAPETTTSAAPKPTTTQKATPTPPPPPPKPTTTAAASSGGSGGQTVTGGKGTFFFQGGAAGSCGVYNSDDTPLVAVDAAMMKPSLCGKFVEITNLANQKKVKAKIQDTCPGCPNAASLDLSVGAFNAIADPATGVIDIEYTILN